MFKAILFLIILASLPSSACAELDAVSRGYVQLRLNNDKHESESGIGISSHISDNVDFRFIGSIITNEFDNEPRVNIALLDFHTVEEKLGIRAGRIQNELGFYTSQLNWVPARDMYMAPQGIYRENFRYMRRSGDGVQPYIRFNTPEISHEITFTYTHRGVLYPMNDITNAWSSAGGVINEDESKNYGLSYAAYIKPIRTDIRWDYNSLEVQLENTNMNGFYDGGVDTISNYIGTRTYLTDELEVTLEYIRIKKTGDTFHKMDKTSSGRGYNRTMESSEAFGVSVGYQINSLFKLTGGWSAFYATPGDKYGDDLKRAGVNTNNMYTEDTFIALKYRKDDIIITAENHFMKGTTTLNKMDADKIKDPYHNIYVLTLTYVFQ